jgi:2-iminobutanoate/2-iminopropanoate deaminase
VEAPARARESIERIVVHAEKRSPERCDEENRVVGVGDARAQAERVWHNIRLACEAAGGSLADVVKITIFLKDIRHAPAEIGVREQLFEPGRYPICTLVQVANLGLDDLLMEVDAVAYLGS